MAAKIPVKGRVNNQAKATDFKVWKRTLRQFCNKPIATTPPTREWELDTGKPRREDNINSTSRNNFSTKTATWLQGNNIFSYSSNNIVTLYS